MLREARGLTQVELAEQAGLKQPAISALERGATKKPEAETILRIAAVLRASPQYIMWDSDHPDMVIHAIQALAGIWHLLTDEQKNQVAAYARGLVDAAKPRPIVPKRPPPDAH